VAIYFVIFVLIFFILPKFLAKKKTEHLVSEGSAPCIFILKCQDLEILKNGAVVCVRVWGPL
jgi:hypothetical protein